MKITYPPQNIEAEQLVLGMMLTSLHMAIYVQCALDENDFYREAHRIIFNCAGAKYGIGKQRVKIISNALAELDKLEDAGGKEYLDKLADFADTAKVFCAPGKILDTAIADIRLKSQTRAIQNSMKDIAKTDGIRSTMLTILGAEDDEEE